MCDSCKVTNSNLFKEELVPKNRRSCKMTYRTPSYEMQAIKDDTNGIPKNPMAPEPATAFRPYKERPTRTDPLKVLVADDESSLRRMYRRLLGVLSCEVDTAETAIEAWNLYQKNKYDLVMTDMQMEAYDAGKVLFELIKDTEDPAPVYIISGGSIGKTIEDAKAAGAKVLNKPFSLEMLEEIVNRHK